MRGWRDGDGAAGGGGWGGRRIERERERSILGIFLTAGIIRNNKENRRLDGHFILDIHSRYIDVRLKGGKEGSLILQTHLDALPDAPKPNLT